MKLQDKVDALVYEDILDFVGDFAAVIVDIISSRSTKEPADGFGLTNGYTPSKAKSHSTFAVARKIVQGVQNLLEQATTKVCQLNKMPPEDNLRRVRALLDAALSAQASLVYLDDVQGSQNGFHSPNAMLNGNVHRTERASSSKEVYVNGIIDTSQRSPLPTRSSARKSRVHGTNGDEPLVNGTEDSPSQVTRVDSNNLLATSVETGGQRALLTQQGVPWYMGMFHLEGTTVEEKPWEGRELIIGEDLSDMDEEEMSGLVGETNGISQSQIAEAAEIAAAAKRKKANAKKRKRLW